ncbi:MAG: TIGR01212 family radical SAM protein [Gammaproteobacteria bacterium]|nr:TIGR01212 family radical SAM protein [Gammaproteobacteria bacterium]
MYLSHYVNTFGRYARRKFGQRVHKLAIDAAFTCPNRDGTKGIGGCTFCNNSSFSPNGRNPLHIPQQIDAGRNVIKKRTGATKFIAYFQAYTNTYADVGLLKQLYDQALSEPDVIGLSIGTRPDCVPDKVLDLLCSYQDQGHEVWLELGLQSAFDRTLDRVNRGHGLAEYRQAVTAARRRQLPICTHLIAGLPGEQLVHTLQSFEVVLNLGVQGLKMHPLHVVKGTRLASSWRRGEYQPLTLEQYVQTVVEVIRRAPDDLVFHRLTGTARANILLGPDWCVFKWKVLNAICTRLAQENHAYASPLSQWPLPLSA